MIQKGFEKKYGSANAQDVTDYLEKIIQIYFEMPPLMAENIRYFLAKLGFGDDSGSIAQILLGGLESNPRKLKRFLNNVEIQRRLVATRNLGIENNILIKLACITYGWKQVWSQIIDNPPLLSELQKYAVDKELSNRIGENLIVKGLFESENRLKLFLSNEPYFSDDHVKSYIFLAKATQTDLTPKTSSESLFREFRDPFRWGIPVSDSGMVFGREELLHTVLQLIADKDVPMAPVVSLYGSRRIGKTTLLYQISQQLPSFDALAIRIDLQGFFGFVDSPQKFLFALAKSIDNSLEKNVLKKRNEKPAELEFFEFESFLSEVLSSVPNKNIVLLMDEFDAIFQMAESRKNFQIEIFGFLRALVMHNPRLRMIVCGLRGLYSLSRRQTSFASEFFNVSREGWNSPE